VVSPNCSPPHLSAWVLRQALRLQTLPGWRSGGSRLRKQDCHDLEGLQLVFRRKLSVTQASMLCLFFCPCLAPCVKVKVAFCSVTLFQERFLHLSNHVLTATPKQAQHSLGQAPAWIIRLTKEWSVSGHSGGLSLSICSVRAGSEDVHKRKTGQKVQGLFFLMSLPLLLHGFLPESCFLPDV